LLRDLDEIRRALSEFNNKDKLFVEVRDNSDEIERIKKRMREIEAERDHILAHLDFLNKVTII
jgi:seryl-tRNA synthetase